MVDWNPSAPYEKGFHSLIEVLRIKSRKPKFNFIFDLPESGVNVLAYQDPLCTDHSEQC